MNWLKNWSFHPLDPAFQTGYAQSKVVHGLGFPFFWLKSKLAPFTTDSWAAQKALPLAAFWMTLMILFISPFIGSKLTGIIIFCAGGLTALRLLLSEEELPLGALVSLSFLFIAWGAVSTAFSPFWKLSLLGYSKTLTYAIAYVCFLMNIRTLKELRITLNLIIFAAVIVSVYGIYQWRIKVPPLALWDDPDSNYKITRVYSFLGNPNLLGGYLLPTLALTGMMVFEEKSWRKFPLAWAFLVQLACLYFTYSRGAWIAVAGALGVGFLLLLVIYWPLFQKNKTLKYALYISCVGGLLGAVAFVLSSPAMMERIRSLFQGSEHSSNQFRINVWQTSFDIIKIYGWTGVGLGNKVFQRIYTYYMATGFQALSTYNVFLEVWVEMGIFGLLSFVWMLWAHSLRCLWGVTNALLNPARRLYFAAALMSLTGLMLHGMVDTVFYRPPVQILFWFSLALVTLLSRESFAHEHD